MYLVTGYDCSWITSVEFQRALSTEHVVHCVLVWTTGKDWVLPSIYVFSCFQHNIFQVPFLELHADILYLASIKASGDPMKNTKLWINKALKWNLHLLDRFLKITFDPPAERVLRS